MLDGAPQFPQLLHFFGRFGFRRDGARPQQLLDPVRGRLAEQYRGPDDHVEHERQQAALAGMAGRHQDARLGGGPCGGRERIGLGQRLEALHAYDDECEGDIAEALVVRGHDDERVEQPGERLIEQRGGRRCAAVLHRPQGQPAADGAHDAGET